MRASSRRGRRGCGAGPTGRACVRTPPIASPHCAAELAHDRKKNCFFFCCSSAPTCTNMLCFEIGDPDVISPRECSEARRTVSLCRSNGVRAYVTYVVASYLRRLQRANSVIRHQIVYTYVLQLSDKHGRPITHVVFLPRLFSFLKIFLPHAC